MNFARRVNFSIALLTLMSGLGFAQLTVPDYTACPNQPLQITATWNNVSNITYTLNPGNFIQNNNPTFNITTPSVTTIYTMCAIGSSLSVPVNSCDQFTVFVNSPPPLVIGNQGDYCHGSTAVLTAPVGGISYTVQGPPGVANIISSSNVITIPNLTQVPYNGSYTVSTVLSGCLSSGITAINVAPNHQISVNSPSNVCQGGNVNLTASMLTATAFVWTGPNGYNSPPDPTSFICNSTSQSGVYTVYSDINFNGITCPRSATTSINVVATSQVGASASPSKTICEGANLNLISGVPSGVPQGYTWQGPQGFNSSLQNPVLTAAIPNMSGTYTVTALFFNSAITCTTSAAVTVSIIGVAQPIIAGNTNTCQGKDITLSVNATGAQTYSWSGPNNFAAANVSAISINSIQPNQAGTYFVYAFFNGGTAVTCITSKSIQVNVVSINSISVIPPGQVCEPNNAYLQANAIGASSYVWTGPNNFGPVPTANAIVYYPTPSASGVYSVTAYFVNGVVTCSNTAVTSLTVNPLLNFTLSPTYQVICYNQPLNINGPSGATSYTWTSSNGYGSNSQNIQIPSAQPNLSGSYTLQVSLGPCITTGTTLVQVLTPIQFTLTPQDRTVCRGDTILLQGGVSGGSQNYAYIWNPAVYLGSNNGSTQVGVPLGTTVYNLIAYDNACPNYSVAHSFTVNVKQPPSTNLNLLRTEGCAPLCMTFPKTQEDAYVVMYDFGGIDQFQSNDDTSTYHCLTSSGTYTLNVISTGTNGCTGTYEYPAPLVVYPKPGTEMLWEPESPTVTDNITLYTNNKVEPVGFTWMISNSSVTGFDTTNLQRPEVNYEVAGTYPVIVITKTDKECIDTVTRYLEVRDDYNIYIPNTFTPNNDGLNDVFMVIGSGFKTDGFVMEITDAWGTLIFTSNDPGKGWDGTIGGQIAKDGVYIYKVKVVGANGEGRQELTGHVNVFK